MKEATLCKGGGEIGEKKVNYGWRQVLLLQGQLERRVHYARA